jgi:drug/metabolite transporter (DMT)-like permease
MSWLLPTAAALVLFGLWGVVIKYATGKLDVVSLSFFNTLSSLILIAAIFGYFWFSKAQISITQEGVYIALAAGVIAILAVLFEAMAFKVGSISIVGPMIAVGVAAFTATAGVLLFKEAMTTKLLLGIALALVSIYLLSS